MSDIAQNEEAEENSDLFEHYSVIADKGQEPLRVDKFLIDRIPNISRNKIQLAAKSEGLLVNDVAVKSNYKVRPLDKIVLLTPNEKRQVELIPENIPLEILFEDEQVVVINKPAGLVVHPGYGNFTGTLVNALIYHFNNLPSASDDTRPGLVHRLDKNTSGVMVIAKTEWALTSLAKQFFERTSKRTYQALVWGEPNQEGSIEGHIGRHLKNRKVMDVFPDGEYGKHALTHYKILEKFHYVSLVECRLETGRTHQIRAHFKHIGHPLFGDVEYGGDKILKGTTFTKYKQFVQNCLAILPRQALHAKTLGFTHPTSKKFMEFDSQIPEDFSEVLKKWGGYAKQLD